MCLEKGVNEIESIYSNLLRFRKNTFGVIPDIWKAFLQISLHNNDQNFMQVVIVYRHNQVVFGVSSSSLLGAWSYFGISLN